MFMAKHGFDESTYESGFVELPFDSLKLPGRMDNVTITQVT